MAVSKLADGPRFLRQRDLFRCGPLALLNLHKLHGRDVTREDLSSYTDLLGCCPRHGTPEENFSRAVHQVGRHMGYARFRFWIDHERSAIVLTRHPRGMWHYFLVVGIGECKKDGRHGFIAVNFAPSIETVSLINFPYMKWLLQYSTVWTFPKGT